MNPNDHRLKTDTETIAPWYPALRPRRTHRVECWLSEEEYQSLCKAGLREDRVLSAVLRQVPSLYLRRNGRALRSALHRNLNHPQVRAYLDFLMLKSDVLRNLVDALTRQLDAEKYVEVNGKLTAVPDNAARAGQWTRR